MRTLIAIFALTAIACGEATDNTTQVVPIEPAATAAADAPAAEAKADAEAPSHAYVCPMCEGVGSDEPGDCPTCGMPLVKPEDAAGVDAEAYHAAHDHDHAAHGEDCPHKAEGEAKAEGEDCDCGKKGEHAGHGDHADCPHHKAEAGAEAAAE